MEGGGNVKKWLLSLDNKVRICEDGYVCGSGDADLVSVVKDGAKRMEPKSWVVEERKREQMLLRLLNISGGSLPLLDIAPRWSKEFGDALDTKTKGLRWWIEGLAPVVMIENDIVMLADESWS